MKKILNTLLLLATIALSVLACRTDDGGDPPLGNSNAADLVLYNGAIYTVNDASLWAEAVAVKNGKIVYIGDDAGIDDYIGENTTVANLNGKMVMPGIHDIHTHPLEAMSPLGSCFLDSQETDPENFIGEAQSCAGHGPEGVDWMFGFGHSVYTMFDAERPPVEILDEAVNDQPAVFMEETSHSVWVNSLALQEAGIDASTPNPVGGVIFKDADGNPNGILMDAAGDFMMDVFWEPTPTIKELNYQGLLEAIDLLAENGITSVCEGRTYWRREFQDAWIRAEDEGLLKSRAILCLWGYPHLDDTEQIATLKSMYRNDPDKLVRMNQIKVYSDGIVTNTTAAMHAPYNLDLEILPENKGLNYFSQSRLDTYISELETTGFDFHIHAIGDRAITESLDAISSARQTNGDIGARHRLTHLEIVRPSDYPRFAELNVTADCQVAGDFTQPENWAENADFIGDRSNKIVPLKDLHEAGARMALSSDWDVSDLNPFVGMQNALTRAPQNLPDLATVIKAYTINAAYVMRQENKVGTLEVGKEADMIILNQNIFEIPVTDINTTKVDKTYLRGNEVYTR